MIGFLFALALVFMIRAFAFRGTNSDSFAIDVILLIVFTICFNCVFA